MRRSTATPLWVVILAPASPAEPFAAASGCSRSTCPRDERHLDQRSGELALQLGRGRDLARVEQGEDLLLERPTDPRQLGQPPGTGQLLDRDRALTDHARGLAIGEHPIPDRSVELVERRQLAEGVSDLRISHPTRNTIGASRDRRYYILYSIAWAA